MRMPRLLLVDDEPSLILDQVTHVFGPRGLQIDVAETGRSALQRATAQPPDVILLDVRLPDLPGLEVFRQLRQIDARIPVIFITAAATTETAIEAMKQGASDYLFKPLDLQQLTTVVSQALEVGRFMREPALVAQTPPEGECGHVLIGHCPAMREVYKAIGRIADQNIIGL